MSKTLDRISLLETFVRIADAGSISAAARDLGLSQPSVSRQLQELETRFQVQLMRRTTHSLALTEAGADLLADARTLIDGWESLEERHIEVEGAIRGKLNVVAPIALGQMHLAQIAWQFQIDHPEVTIAWQLDDQPIKFAEVGCDCWIKVGPVPDETLVVRKLGSVRRILIASKGFVREHGIASSPKQVERLPFIALDPFEGGHIPLTHPDKRPTEIRPQVRSRTNNIFALKEAVTAGIGAAVMPRWFVTDELKSGQFVDVVPNWQAPSLDINVCYLPGRHQTQRLRAFLKSLEVNLPNIAGIDA
ncbi:MAG: LysR family transcriptional regulator [Pseudomonadota bacterium]